jgi:hypothetical protein
MLRQCYEPDNRALTRCFYFDFKQDMRPRSPLLLNVEHSIRNILRQTKMMQPGDN